jgi:hypothetical protein
MYPTNKYLTPEDYEIALANGISKDLLNARFYRLKWDNISARETPVRKLDDDGWHKWKHVAVVSMISFYNRKKKGWSGEKAALTPSQSNFNKSRI